MCFISNTYDRNVAKGLYSCYDTTSRVTQLA
jgi:hypothetical protein